MSSAGTSSQSTGDETAAVARQLAEARAELAAMHGLQASFAHGVSHDLRAPLRAIDSFSALLATHLGGGLDDTSRDYIARIRGASARTAELIDALLELSPAMRADMHQAPVGIRSEDHQSELQSLRPNP